MVGFDAAPTGTMKTNGRSLDARAGSHGVSARATPSALLGTWDGWNVYKVKTTKDLTTASDAQDLCGTIDSEARPVGNYNGNQARCKDTEAQPTNVPNCGEVNGCICGSKSCGEQDIYSM